LFKFSCYYRSKEIVHTFIKLWWKVEPLVDVSDQVPFDRSSASR